MRPVWSGGISFGLIYIPVKMYSATKPVELDLDMLSKKDKAPIRYARIDSSTGKEVAWKDIVKGYEYKKGDYVILDDADFEKADMEKSDSISIDAFVEEEDIDPIYFEKPYYLEPDKGAKKTYALLRDALKKSGKVGVAEFVLRNREHLCVIKPDHNLLVVNQMRYSEEIRDSGDLEIPGKSEASKQEIEVATELIEKMTERFDIRDYKDNYIDKLKDLITAKAKHKPIKVSKAKKSEPTELSELMEKLRASLAEIEVERKK